MSDLVKRQSTFAVNVAKLILHINESGYTCTLGEAFRTREQAKIYVDQGIGIMNSQHCCRLAIDLNLFKDGTYLTEAKEYVQFGKYWETLDPDNRSGFNFKNSDANHFEMRKNRYGSTNFNGSIK